jgi:hypothetical protein
MVNGPLNPTSGEPKASPSLPNPKVFCHRSQPRLFPTGMVISGEPKASPSLPNPIQSSGEPKASPDTIHLSKMVRVLDRPADRRRLVL